MKLMLLTAATGGGHLRASCAVEKYILENTAFEVVTVDTFKSISSFLDKTICESYLIMARRAPKLFGKLYNQTNRPTRFSKIVPKFNRYFSKLLLPTILRESPDVIIATHPFAAEMVSNLKKSRAISQPLICIITDYGLHRAWISENIDSYVVASDEMVDELVDFGVDRDKVFPFGIPVLDSFFTKTDYLHTLKEMNFDPEIPTVLFMAGSFGVNNIIKFYKDLHNSNISIQLIIITGKNKKLYDSFQKEIEQTQGKTTINAYLIYYTDEVQKYMHAADLLVTKPGGLTVSEALACNLPLAVFDAIPGQEEDNARFLNAHDMAVRISGKKDFAEIISSLVAQKERLHAMRENCKGFDKSRSVPDLLRLVEDLSRKQAGS